MAPTVVVGLADVVEQGTDDDALLVETSLGKQLAQTGIHLQGMLGQSAAPVVMPSADGRRRVEEVRRLAKIVHDIVHALPSHLAQQGKYHLAVALYLRLGQHVAVETWGLAVV